MKKHWSSPATPSLSAPHSIADESPFYVNEGPVAGFTLWLEQFRLAFAPQMSADEVMSTVTVGLVSTARFTDVVTPN